MTNQRYQNILLIWHLWILQGSSGREVSILQGLTGVLVTLILCC